MPAYTIRIGHLSTVYHTAYLLKGSNLLGINGLQATWTLFPSGPDIISAMQQGKIDLGYIGLPPVIIGIDRGLSLACIGGGHVEGTIIIAGRSIRSISECGDMKGFLSQLSGKTIGTPPRGSIHDVIVNDLLQTFDRKNITIKNYPWADFLPDEIMNGGIVAAAGTPALATTSIRYGNGKIVVPPDHLWPFNPSYGIIVMRAMLENRDILARFLATHETACEWIRKDPVSCARIVAETTGMVDPGFVFDTYRISPKYCAALPPEYIESTMKFARTLHALGYTSREITKEELFELSLIEHIHPENHHYSDGISD